jgi:hypothetical protein
MGRYIHYFETETEFNEARTNNYVEPWVSYTEEVGVVAYNKPDYTKIPFTIESLGSGDITWGLDTKTVQYSKNGGPWETMDSGTTISVVEGDKIQFKGTNTNYSANTFSVTTQFNVKGNVMSLTDGDDFETANSVNTHSFEYLFRGCCYLVSASDLKLPATTLADQCYRFMFSGCTSLTSAPELPATTLANNCYEGMFYGCTSLTAAPELPAMTLANYCYHSMFRGCTSLTTAPELPATTLTIWCYHSMFRGCTSLTTAPELPATTLTASCYVAMFYRCTNLNYIKAMFIELTEGTTNSWLSGVAETGTFVKNASATWTTTDVSGVPSGWTVQTQ